MSNASDKLFAWSNEPSIIFLNINSSGLILKEIYTLFNSLIILNYSLYRK